MLRLGRPGNSNACPADESLSLPTGRHSHGLTRLAALGAVRDSFDSARCGNVVGVRDSKDPDGPMVALAAADRVPSPGGSRLLCMTWVDVAHALGCSASTTRALLTP
ncbi:hypothetical protein GCM10010191_67330 [Actinomadura vinacea]|uniref:Uncharacterized protein n=1 Tax=Actinomadura vinacea TaxID=115336 RepID=A0ABP5X1I7_9ACTN